MNPRMNPDFVGAGWAFPVRTDVTGGIALVTREREIEESVRLILATAPGERPMRPEFGCAVHDYVFAPADASTAGAVAYAVRVALDRWEPRIELRDVTVQYALRCTNDPRNLVFPFYTIPEHAPTSPGG